MKSDAIVTIERQTPPLTTVAVRGYNTRLLSLCLIGITFAQLIVSVILVPSSTPISTSHFVYGLVTIVCALAVFVTEALAVRSVCPFAVIMAVQVGGPNMFF